MDQAMGYPTYKKEHYVNIGELNDRLYWHSNAFDLIADILDEEPPSMFQPFPEVTDDDEDPAES